MCYNGKYKKKQYCKMEQIYKIYLSTDYRLKFIYMKLESQVIVNQHVTVNLYIVLYTLPVIFGEIGFCEV